MPDPRAKKPLPPNIVAQILLGEAASEGLLGLQFVRDVMVNRGRASGKSLEEIATAPAQFSAYSRPDLEAFYQQQPATLRALAEQLVAEGRAEDYQPAYPEQHYTTTDFYETRQTLPPKHWIHSMEPSRTVGAHVALRPRRRQ